MEQENAFAVKQMEELLDNAPLAVYVRAYGCQKLLYANRMARELDLEDAVFVQSGETNLSGCTNFEFQDPKTCRIYHGSRRLISWNEQDAYMEYLSDITDKKLEEDRLRAAKEELISDLKETELEMSHLINSIPGGIASFRVEEGRFIPTYFSDGVMALSGHNREEFWDIVKGDALASVYESDRKRVFEAAEASLISGEVLDISYRTRHKNGNLVWIHLNGRRMGQFSKVMRFYAVYTGMSADSRLYRDIVNEAADGVYIIDRENYDLLYANESKQLFINDPNCIGKKCYQALYGKDAPCEFCTLKSHEPDGEEHPLQLVGNGRFYSTRFRETDWNGIPAYVKSVRDITNEIETRREKERLDQYFQTVLKNLPGGVAVVDCEPDGRMVPEFLSDGFATMTGMTMDEAWSLYQKDAMTGVHPDDLDMVKSKMAEYIASGKNNCELLYRLKKGNYDYIWVKNTLTLIQSTGGASRVYAMYHDMTKELEDQERMRQQYKDLILQHYSTPDPNALIIGHCNISQDKILEIIDHTDSELLKTFGTVRESFFTGIGNLVVDEEERRQFMDMYLNAPALAAFRRNETEQILRCFIKLPKEQKGRYVQFKVNLVETPDTGDITGILTVTDITEQTISDLILHQLSVTSFDFVIDLNLDQDTYTVLTNSKALIDMPVKGCHSKWTASMASTTVVPKDKEQYARLLDASEMRKRLAEEGPYTFSYSMADNKGDIRTKNIIVSAIDLRLGRACLVRTDITESLREQQGLLNMMAYTFELMGFINIHTGHLTMYTRDAVLQNLAPYTADDYNDSIGYFSHFYESDEGQEEIMKQFCLETLLQKLSEKPAGYDFVFPYTAETGIRYKQINVLWGDADHRTVCLVRADVTDMLAAERQTKKTLESALTLAKVANQAKSDFLSAMSHDIRTPMNAIMGMTTLAEAHMNDKDRLKDCLQKISVSSKHLLSLINDVLDMSKIESSKIALNRIKIALPGLIEQLFDIMAPQAETAGIQFNIDDGGICHKYFYGDNLRINQIFINILSNAIKFTPEGGRVRFGVEEIAPEGGKDRVRYRFTVSDTGIGISKEFQAHIFEPFTRSNSAARIEGTGLGLSITKGLVELMEGEISVRSRENEGSIFRVELEFDAAFPESDMHEQNKDMQYTDGERRKIFAGRHFLVAEDNAINAEILCELLQMYQAEVVVKTDGVQAVQAFEVAPSGTYDAILMDVQMPRMDGYSATCAIRRMQREDAKQIPIIAMTANAFAEDIQEALDAGMNAHVAKPIDMEILQMALGKEFGKAGVRKKQL